jgi:CTP synthase (UTP-ammonia lyase)
MPNPEVKIALIAKYVNEDNEYVFEDAYSSVIKALKHAAVFVSRRLKYVLINAEHLEPVENGLSEDHQKDHQEAWEKLKQCK